MRPSKQVGVSRRGRVAFCGLAGWLACHGATTSPPESLVDGGDRAEAGAVESADGAVIDARQDERLDADRDAPAIDGTIGGRGGSADAGGTAGGVDPFFGSTVKPDVSTAKVDSCAGQPDLTLCNLVTAPDRWYDVCVGGQCVSPGCGETSCNVPAPHFSIPANSNHDHLQVQRGSEPVVIDLVTGLHWQGCDAGRSGEGCTAGARRSMTWPEAVTYCDALTWSGKDDFYLPDQYELLSIDDWAKTSDQYSLDPVAFPLPSNAYWSTHFVSRSRIYGVQFRAGNNTIIYDWVTDVSDVRCVRRGFSRTAGYTTRRFTRTGATITDAATGLTWQRCASGRSGSVCMYDGAAPTEHPSSGAIAYCDALAAGGFDDWRLPTFKELHSVVEFPPRSTTADPEIVALDADRPYLLCRAGWQPGARVLLMSVRGGGPVIPNELGKYPIICVRGH